MERAYDLLRACPCYPLISSSLFMRLRDGLHFSNARCTCLLRVHSAQYSLIFWAHRNIKHQYFSFGPSLPGRSSSRVDQTEYLRCMFQRVDSDLPICHANYARSVFFRCRARNGNAWKFGGQTHGVHLLLWQIAFFTFSA